MSSKGRHMPRNRKLFIHNTPIFITSRVEEGLPLVASRVMNVILWGILARARSMYDIRVCHFLFMANHFHMLAVVDNPKHVDDFVRHIKTESSHAINRLMGRRKRTVWCEGYDSPTVLTEEDVLRYIVYIYTNPQNAKLVRRIEDYPNVSSWQMYTSNTNRSTHTWIRRPEVSKRDLASMTEGEQKALIAEFRRRNKAKHEFILEPDAWMACFGIQGKDRESIYHKQIIARVREKETTLQRHVESVLGVHALRRQSIKMPHTPTKFSRRMICLCSDIPLRRSFIEFFRSLCDKARKAFQDWKRGIYRPWPPGLLAPGGVSHGNLVPWFVS